MQSWGGSGLKDAALVNILEVIFQQMSASKDQYVICIGLNDKVSVLSYQHIATTQIHVHTWCWFQFSLNMFV